MNAAEKARALSDAVGPETKTVDVVLNGVTQQFTIKRLSFFDAQRIATVGFDVGDDGKIKYSPDSLARRASAIVSATVINEDGSPGFTEAEARALHPAVGRQLGEASNDFNGMNTNAVETAAKNS